MEKYTIKNLAEGEIAVTHSGTQASIQMLGVILKAAFPEDFCRVNGNNEYYFKHENPQRSNEWNSSNSCPDVRAIVSVEDLISYVIGATTQYTDGTCDAEFMTQQDCAAADGKRVFASGSHRDSDDNKPLPLELNPYMLLRYGFHMKTGQRNYGEGNWQLGQPDVKLWDCLSRHIVMGKLVAQFPELAATLGLDKEDHLSAAIFNINMLMHNEANAGVAPDKFFKKI